MNSGSLKFIYVFMYIYITSNLSIVVIVVKLKKMLVNPDLIYGKYPTHTESSHY